MMQFGLALQEIGRAMMGTGVFIFILAAILFFYLDDI